MQTISYQNKLFGGEIIAEYISPAGTGRGKVFEL